MKLTLSLLTIFLAAGTASYSCAAEDLTVVSNVTTNGKPGRCRDELHLGRSHPTF